MQIYSNPQKVPKSVATILVESTFLSFLALYQQMDDKTSKSEKEAARNREAIDAAAPELWVRFSSCSRFATNEFDNLQW